MGARATITRIDAFVFRFPNERPVATSFGVMRDRPAVFVRVETEDGAFGWGEIFANWPAAGAEHRANLLIHDIADLVLGHSFEAPGDLLHKLEHETRIRAIQCGEQGPFRQVAAGLDIAMWDLFACRAGQPLRHILNNAAAASVPAYASGIAVQDAADAIAKARKAGHHMFKVKVGFDLEGDAKAVRELTRTLSPHERLAADANQVWDLVGSLAFLKVLGDASLSWLEEPMPVDAPDADWRHLAKQSKVPLAGGENLAGLDAFDAAIAAGSLTVLQPDVAKWGGITGCRLVAARAMAAGRRYCPHFLGGGIGLLASAHLLAAVGGDGVALEVDINDNPLRDAFFHPQTSLSAGRWHLDDRPGLGVDALPPELSPFQTLNLTKRAQTRSFTVPPMDLVAG